MKHRMAWFKDHPVPPAATGRDTFHYPRCLGHLPRNNSCPISHLDLLSDSRKAVPPCPVTPPSCPKSLSNSLWRLISSTGSPQLRPGDPTSPLSCTHCPGLSPRVLKNQNNLKLRGGHLLYYFSWICYVSITVLAYSSFPPEIQPVRK